LEYIKNVKGIREEKLTLDEFESIFRKKYHYKRYYGGKAKDIYDLKMGSMRDEECTTKFLEVLRYVPYLKDEKVKIQRFISGFSLTYKRPN